MLSSVGKLKIQPRSTELKKLGIDEIALVKGQGNYVAVLVDISNSKLLEIVPSRRQEDLRKVLLSWGSEVLNGIEEVSIDLWKPYKSLVKELMPNADVVGVSESAPTISPNNSKFWH
ncbi:MAG: transposase [Hormoscilla sp. GUM202]|nr:transposase [Hormoscilla sp. GUM202]